MDEHVTLSFLYDLKPEQRYQYFLGDCFGILLLERMEDHHAIVKILVEDDGNWFVTNNNGFDSFWLEDLQRQLSNAENWCRGNLIRTSDQYGHKYGWQWQQSGNIS